MENVCTFTLRLSNGYLFELPKPAVMGIINTSPNSFYNPHLNFGDALSTVDYMVAAGANILDIGGEATNPFVDIVNVSFVGNVDIITLTVFSAEGRLVQSKRYQVGGIEMQVDLSNLSTGLYHLRLEGSTIKKTVKLLKR